MEHIGERFTKNGVDIVIEDPAKQGANKIAAKFQSKYNGNAASTERALKNYHFVQKLVSSDQVDLIDGTKVTDTIEYKGISSTPLSKTEAKEKQQDIQNGDQLVYNWDSINNGRLALAVGKQAANAGIMSAAMTAGTDIAVKVITGEPVYADEVVSKALESGADAAVKQGVAGSLIIASEKGIIKSLANVSKKGITNIAFCAVENAKIAKKVAEGELSAAEGLGAMCDVTTATIAGTATAVKGEGIGAALGFTALGVPGMVIGGFVGGVVGYAAGSTVGQAVSKGVRTVAKAAGHVIKSVGSAIVDAGRTVVRGIKSFFSSIFSW